MKIKIIRGDKSLIGKILNLERTDECLYESKGYFIVDTDNELEAMQSHTESIFFNLHLFNIGEDKLQFIDEVEVINNNKP